MAEDILNSALEILQCDSRITPAIFNSILKKIKIVKKENNFIIISCRDSYSINIIKDKKNNIIAALEDAFSLILERKINVSVVEENDTKSLESAIIAERKATNQNNSFNNNKTNLQSLYTFENFIVGNCNRYAHAASICVADKPGQTQYNPLFLWGNSGLGKTHLMQAIGNRIVDIHPGMRVIYTTCENFTNEYIKSINSKNYNEFRDMFRNVDVLMIDDIQFLIGKEGVQSEFFNTFETLINNGKQIIITSDKAPTNLISLDERLTSRFQNGYTMDVQPPDFETRKAIIISKLKDNPILMSEEVIDYICENATSHIRQLNGAFNILTSFYALSRNEITLDDAKSVLYTFFSPKKAEQITPEMIMTVVSQYYGIDISKITSKSRSRDILEPRNVCMYLFKEKLENITLKGIGKYFGGKDHTTVINAIEKVDANERLLHDIEEILKSLPS
ncbi:MAG: chromosomal replication initiator protein DnaA [Clostridia bacterium]|nr:chromosomal replication initiator protein DnaA [Clostridia bacterium]